MRSLKKLEQINDIKNKLTFTYKVIKILISKSILKQFIDYTDAQFNGILDTILNLRSDLATRLTEQQQILESAKSEVEKNISGTPELIAVSEAQKTRLERQIEQFEELQKVLVKV